MREKKYAWTASDCYGMSSLEVLGLDWTNEPGIGQKHVTLERSAGSMTFRFSMTPAQAREMAMAMIAAAEALA